MSIARTAIGAGLFAGMEAYLQGFIHDEGEPDSWVVLPRAWWPPQWYTSEGTDRYKCPCCKLKEALYGHPVSGRRWEQRLGSLVR
eukprot:5279493-Amphidinium_carterae.1